MPDHMTITLTENPDGEHYDVESDVEATSLTDLCAMAGAMIAELTRLHDEAHYLNTVRN